MSSSPHVPSKEKPSGDGGVQFKLSLEVDPELIRNFPKQVARDFGVVPLGRFGSKTLLLAADTELSSEQLKELRRILGKRVHIVPSPGSELQGVLEGVFDGSKVEDAVDQPTASAQEVVEKGDMETAQGKESEAEFTQQEESTEELETSQAEESESELSQHQKVLAYAEGTHYEGDPKPLSEVLVDLEFLSQEELEKFLNEQKDPEKADFDPSSFIDAQVLRLVPEDLARKDTLLPLLQIEGDLLVAAAEYLDAQVVAEIR